MDDDGIDRSKRNYGPGLPTTHISYPYAKAFVKDKLEILYEANGEVFCCFNK